MAGTFRDKNKEQGREVQWEAQSTSWTQKCAGKLSGWDFPRLKQITDVGSSVGSAVHVIDTKLGWQAEWLVLPTLKHLTEVGSSLFSAVHVTDT